jgi:crotonobetainyl-CoA:carnitine CoA-transferase CaiB-like acyl-CoA transferase
MIMIYAHVPRQTTKTNADRIRSMSDEELADWLARTQIANVAEALEVAKIPYEPENCLKDEVAKDCLEWLKQPAEVKGDA